MLVIPRNLRAALLHGEYMRADANYTFAPLDLEGVRFLRRHWDGIRVELARSHGSQSDVFNDTHFSYAKFEEFLLQCGLKKGWPRTGKSGAPRLDKDTWELMCGLRADLVPVHQFYKTMVMPNLNVACDADGRNRVLFGAFGTITSRNTPGHDDRGRFIFGLPKWARFLMRPPEGWSLAYIDWSSQEYGIAAILSGDENMRKSYETGDPYIQFAVFAGAAPSGASKSSHPFERKLYKSATLAIGYGQGQNSFSEKTGVGRAVADKVFRQYKSVYSRFWRWREEQSDQYAISLKLATKLGWTLHHGSRVKPTTVLNFTAQTVGAEMLRLAVIEMMHAGVKVCCPVHDAVLIEAPTQEIESAIVAARSAMDKASKLLLGGYTLRTEYEITCHPARVFERDGEETWKKIVEASTAVAREKSPFE